MTQTHNNEGRDAIIKCYDPNTLSEIASHGCVTGVASDHIHYHETISFFDKYEAEILEKIEDVYGKEMLYKTFERSTACYDMYRNECTWLFIETVAQDVITQLEQIAEDEEKQIVEYMKESISNNGYTLTELNNAAGINPPQSMTLDRYSQV